MTYMFLQAFLSAPLYRLLYRWSIY